VTREYTAEWLDDSEFETALFLAVVRKNYGKNLKTLSVEPVTRPRVEPGTAQIEVSATASDSAQTSVLKVTIGLLL
jgi:hypothetical protein